MSLAVREPRYLTTRINQRILRFIIQQVTHVQLTDLFIRQDVLDAVEFGAIGHISAGHSPAETVGHIGAGTVNGEAIMEGAAARFHGHRNRFRFDELGIKIKDRIHVLADAGFIERSGMI